MAGDTTPLREKYVTPARRPGNNRRLRDISNIIDPKPDTAQRTAQQTAAGKENQIDDGFELPNTKRNRAKFEASHKANLQAQASQGIAGDWIQGRAVTTALAGLARKERNFSDRSRNVINKQQPQRQQTVKIGAGGVKKVYYDPSQEREAVGQLSIDHQKVGNIVWRDDLKPHTPFEAQDPKRVVRRANGTDWYDKGRFWIIVAVHKNKVIECPVLSFDDKGLSEKSLLHYNPEEYLNCVARGCNMATYQKQAPTMPVLEIQVDYAMPKNMSRSTMIVHFCGAEARDRDDLKGAKFSGQLSESSRALLKKYYIRGAQEIYGPAEEDGQ